MKLRWEHPLLVITLLILVLSLSACSTMDRPWDPDFSKGETLFDQMPNNDNNAAHCAGHLPESQRPAGSTGRC